MPTTDRRFADVREISSIYTFTTPRSKEQWLSRARELRLQILESAGLYPPPPKTPLNAKVFGRIGHDGYTVEKVCFESYPGVYVTGNLYRPTGKKGPFPGVLNPHGHWAYGRLEDSELCSVPGRCISLARMGLVAFSYDMVGYTDSQQVPHSFASPYTTEGQRINMWGISLMGLQLWDSIRAVDFLQSLPDVDPDRIACTGASGGGTQTFLLSAVDDRVKAAAPVNMISGSMQGGCLCENGPGLRVDTNNTEIGALFAPRPLLLVSCTGDWTVNTPNVEFPAIRSVYALLGSPDSVHWVQMNAGHNYNQASREAVYGFLAHALLGRKSAKPIPEKPFVVDDTVSLRVFSNAKPPSGAISAEELAVYLRGASEKQLAAAKPGTKAGLKRFSGVYGPALRHALAVELPRPEDLAIYEPGFIAEKAWTVKRFFLGRSTKGDVIPAVLFTPTDATPNAPATLIVHEGGRKELMEDTSAPGPLIKALMDQGQRVMLIDCFRTGELRGERREAAFFDTYNRTDTSERVQDILTALAFLRRRKDFGSGAINLVGIGKAGLWCLLARGLAPHVKRCAADTAGFDNSSDDAFMRNLFSPSLRRAGDLRTAVTLAVPRPLFLFNTQSRFRTEWMEEVYESAGTPRFLRTQKRDAAPAEIAAWIAGA